MRGFGSTASLLCFALQQLLQCARERVVLAGEGKCPEMGLGSNCKNATFRSEGGLGDVRRLAELGRGVLGSGVMLILRYGMGLWLRGALGGRLLGTRGR